MFIKVEVWNFGSDSVSLSNNIRPVENTEGLYVQASITDESIEELKVRAIDIVNNKGQLFAFNSNGECVYDSSKNYLPKR